MRLFNKTDAKTGSAAETTEAKTSSEVLLQALEELFTLNQKLNAAAVSRMQDIQEEMKELNLQLVDLDSDLVTAEALGQEAEKKRLHKTETELLTRMALFRQRQESILNDTGPVIAKKLMVLIPAFVEAEKEYNQFRKETSEQVTAITLKIKELDKERSRIGYMRHPFNKCRDLVGLLEKAAGLEKGTVNHHIKEIKGPVKVKNPYFN